MPFQQGERRKLLRAGVWLVAGALVLALGLATGPRAETTSQYKIEDVYANELQDLSLTLKRKEINIQQLNKISSEYAQAYRLDRSRIQLKEPGKFRIDGKAGPLKFEYVISGTRRVTRAPLIVGRDEIGDDPGKRQGPIEIGLLTGGCLRGYQVEFVGAEPVEGRTLCQFRLRYAHEPERYELLWFDLDRRYITKRRMFTRAGGEYKMELVYAEPRQVGPLWVPTRIEVRNAEGKLAGVTEQTEIQVNSGLDDSLFKL